ncbi:MAG: T9SS type A sorting domain-containing protein [Ignavibacteriales bacterium]|nr:T9SS type A sorting domain-containing protein [Ignavibacteriales bacterium]
MKKKILFNLFRQLILLGSIGFQTLTAQTNVGVGQTYTTLSAAYNAINSGALVGDVRLIITSDLNETSSAILYASGTGSSNYTSVTIKPDGPTERLVSGNVAAPLINFNGADNVTIDGRFSGSGMYLRFNNLNATNPAIRFINDASNNSINYTYVEGMNTSTSSGVVVISNTSGTTGNDNIIIDNCHVLNSSGGNPYNAIYIDGTLGAENDNLTFSNSRIYGFTNYGINFRSSAYLGGNYTISNNHFYCPFVSDQNQYSIFSVNNNNTGHSFTISGNYIGGNSENAGGTWIKSGGHFFGIYLNAGIGGVASSIQGNIIKNVLWTSGYGDLRPIYVTGANADYDIGNITGNIIDSLANAPTIISCRVSGIYSDADRVGGAVRIMNNSIGNITDNSSHVNSGTRGIYQNGSLTLYTIENNSVHNLTTYSSLRTSGMVGIMTSSPLQSGSTISRNVVYNLFQNNSGADTLDASGIQSSGTSGGSLIVDRNKIYNIQLANFNPGSTIYGIQIASGFGDYINNMVSLGSGESGNYNIAGIYKPAGSSNFYYNTINVEGIVDSGGSNSAAFFREYNGINILKNNIFYNTRSGGTGKHPAIVVNNTSNLTSDYNLFYTSDPNTLGSFDGGTTASAFAEWKSGSGLDANSMNVPVTFTNSVSGDLHLAGSSVGDNNLSGTPLTGDTTDYDGEIRSSTRPYVGADENKTFNLSDWKITSSVIGSGSISPLGEIFIARGDTQSYIITPAAYYHIDSVIVDGLNAGKVATYTFNNVIANHTITAYFSIDLLTITASVNGSGAINPTGSVLAPYGSNRAFSFEPSLGYHIDSLLVDGVKKDSALSYTFYNVVVNHTIKAYFSINVFTVTTSVSGNGTIAPSGTVNVSYGTDRQFGITPGTGYHLDSLLVDDVHSDSITSYTFRNVIANHILAAHFSINVYTITSSVIGNGTITPSGTMNLNYGSNQRFTYTPEIGYHLDSVLVDGEKVDSTAGYTFANIISNHSIVTHFSLNEYHIISSAAGNGTILPSGIITVNHGADQSFSILPGVGYHADSLVVDGGRVDSLLSYTFYNISADHSVMAYFSIDKFTINSSAGMGGNINPPGSIIVNYGTDQTFTFSSNFGYKFDSLLVDNLHVDSAESYTFYNVNSNHDIIAYFSKILYAITTDTKGNGNISPSGIVTIPYGTDQRFDFYPELGYHIDSIFVDGLFVDSLNGYTFYNLSDNHSISVHFVLNVYKIISQKIGEGTIIPFDTTFVNYGENQKYEITPAEGYNLDTLWVDGTPVDSTTSYTFTNVISDHLIVAKFAIRSFTIEATAGMNGTITPDGIIPVNFGAAIQFTITPNEGYHLDSLIVDGGRVDSTFSYTFALVTTNHKISAYFSINVYTVSALSGENGTISPSGDIPLTHGANQRFIFAPVSGYHVDTVLVDGSIVDSTAGYTFYNVTSNHIIEVKFAITLNPLPLITRIVPSNGYRGDVLTVQLIGSNFIPDKSTINTEAGMNVDSIIYSGNDTISAKISIESNAVLGVKNISVSNPAPGGGTSLSLPFNIINHKPIAFNLISPSNSSTIILPYGKPIDFSWNHSTDLDTEDSILYTISIRGVELDTSVSGISDNFISMDIEAKLQMHQNYYWWITATDGYDVVVCADTFSFFTDFGDGVKDVGFGIPEKFAMYQNYPNPFNPTTTIRFDLPVSSTISIKVYNIIGNEVETILLNQRLEPGVKEIQFNSSNYPSGAYFYRLTAIDEKGNYFTTVKRMVLLK